MIRLALFRQIGIYIWIRKLADLNLILAFSYYYGGQGPAAVLLEDDCMHLHLIIYIFCLNFAHVILLGEYFLSLVHKQVSR